MLTRSWFDARVRILDGAMGTTLHARSGHSGAPEELNRTMPGLVTEIHAAYIEAGSDAVTTNSFGGSRVKLGKHGLSHEAAALTAAAVACARRAADASGKPVLVGVSLGPTGELLAPLGALSFDDAYAAFFEQAKAAKETGADYAIAETMSDIAEARAAVLAARDAGLEAVMSLTFDGARMLMGTPADAAALCAQDAGALAVGLNCSGGPEQMLPLIGQMRAACPLPLAVQPNAGLPLVENGVTRFPYQPQPMAEKMKDILSAGAGAIGGCCGTTPEHIAAFARAANGMPAPANIWDGVERIASARAAMPLDQAMSAAEEIPADVDALTDCASDAAILDLRALSPERIAVFLEEAQQMTRVPLLFRAQGEQAEAARRYYHGVSRFFG